MELFLNILWLLIALGVLGVWRGHRFAARERQRCLSSLSKEALALACALLLLFPVISLTDDLHPTLALVEDSATSKRASAGWAALHNTTHAGKRVAVYAVIALPGLCLPSRAVSEQVVLNQELPRETVLVHCPAGRAPPAPPSSGLPNSF